ncbi:thioredoxin-like protein [Lophiotrema nucula]|uniref:Thioredoxin-like protein n=1 Tax=Lophiotrema nucula TaxID=690887 RepID=A0A6A5Z4J1_9PLEO|nr:thioredoxin-like protein [Lophiotrema nucula]
MRSLLYSLLSLATIAPILAADAPAASPTSDGLEDDVPDTIFNGQTVPPMIELTQQDIDEKISHGNWLVEFFSPDCPHCMAFKPTWQTLYEFYYTSKPIISQKESDGDSLNSFTRWYDFKFAKVNCIAYRDTCEKMKIHNFPSIVEYHNGNETKKVKGSKELPEVSKWVEEILESVRPGSRPPGGPKLPKPGDNKVEAGPETEAEVKEKANVENPAVTTSATPTEPSEESQVQLPIKLPANPTGISEPLTAEKFQKLVTNTMDSWFVKFYAPWCHHCQAMQPNWAQMAREMKGKLNVGEVNCDAEKRLCKDAKVKGYPTLLFFRGGERVEYNGLRGIGDLVSFAETTTAMGDGVNEIDLEGFKKMEETEEVIFVYFYDHATTSEDFMALERLTLSLIGHGKLVKTRDPKMSEQFKISTWPRLMVSRDGKSSYYPPISPKDMRDSKKVLNWMKSVWLPIVPELTSSNAREIMDGKFVVLAILNRDNQDTFATNKREIKNAAIEWIDKQTNQFQLERQELRDAKQLRIEEAEDKDDQRALRAAKGIRINMDQFEHKQIGFAWVDGIFWERWIKTTYGVDVKEGEKIVINDEDNRRYWDTTITGEPIRLSRAAILETINKVISSPSKIPAKSTTGSIERFFFNIKTFCGSHPWLAFGMVVGFVLAGSLFGRRRMKKRSFGSGGYFTLDDKNGLLGGGMNGGGKND